MRFVNAALSRRERRHFAGAFQSHFAPTLVGHDIVGEVNGEGLGTLEIARIEQGLPGFRKSDALRQRIRNGKVRRQADTRKRKADAGRLAHDDRIA